MRKLICSLAVLCAWLGASAQTPTINDLYVPTSPGLVLLDKAPESVEKPTNPKAFGIDVFNALSQNHGAINVSPYWLFNHPDLTFRKSVENKMPFLQTLNLSVAGSKMDSGSFLSAGVRAHVFRIYSKKKFDEINKKMVDALSVMPDQLNEGNLSKLGKELGSLRSEPLLSIEVAAAMAGYSGNDNFNTLAQTKYGFWINILSHPAADAPFNFTGVARYINATNAVTSKDSAYVDAGVAASYQKNSVDVQLEYLNRFDQVTKKTYDKTSFIVNYMVSQNVIAVATFGKDFNQVHNIFVLFGVKFGLSTQKVK